MNREVIGDVIGIVCIAVMTFGLMLFAHALQ